MVRVAEEQRLTVGCVRAPLVKQGRVRLYPLVASERCVVDAAIGRRSVARELRRHDKLLLPDRDPVVLERWLRDRSPQPAFRRVERDCRNVERPPRSNAAVDRRLTRVVQPEMRLHALTPRRNCDRVVVLERPCRRHRSITGERRSRLRRRVGDQRRSLREDVTGIRASRS